MKDCDTGVKKQTLLSVPSSPVSKAATRQALLKKMHKEKTHTHTYTQTIFFVLIGYCD